MDQETSDQFQYSMKKAEDALQGIERYHEFISLFLERADKKTKKLWKETHNEVLGW
jgi:hypothetical protein